MLLILGPIIKNNSCLHRKYLKLDTGVELGDLLLAFVYNVTAVYERKSSERKLVKSSLKM